MSGNLCSVCGDNVGGVDRRLCSKCGGSRADLVRKARRGYEDQGKCIYCGQKDPEEGKKGCQACMLQKAEKAASRRKNQLAKDLCPVCGKSANGKSFCRDCLDLFGERAKQRKADRVASKLCWYCGGCPIQSQTLCETCYLKQTSKTHFKTMKKWKQLKEIFDTQQGQCPYSGRMLTLGIDTELDHKIPKAKGGRDEVENLQWVLDIVNRMKWSQLEEDFLNLVSEINEHRSRQI